MKIAVLSGGNSSERTIALQSAKNVIQILSKRFEVHFFDIPKDINKFCRQSKKFAVAVPVFHGPGGESGIVQGFLETLGVAYIFSSPAAHAIGMNKLLTKTLAKTAGVLTPNDKIVSKNKIKFIKPVVVKPVAGGSSIGINIAHSQKELDKFIKFAYKYDSQVYLEDYIKGDEFTVAVIDSCGQTLALPPVAIRSKNKFFDYQSKYDPKLFEEICPAPISVALAKRLKTQAVKIHNIIGCRHISRSDFIVRSGKIYFLEINTIPGMTKNSLLPKAIRAQGLDFAELLAEWILSNSRFVLKYGL